MKQTAELKKWDEENPYYLVTILNVEDDGDPHMEQIHGFTWDPIQAAVWIFEMRQREPVTRKWISRVRKQITVESGQKMPNGEKILTRELGKILGTWQPKKYICPSKKHYDQLLRHYHCDFCGEHRGS